MKRIGLALAAIAAALAGLVLIVPWLTPESAVREALTHEIVTLTGRSPVISGAVHLSLAPLPTVTVDHITIPSENGMPPLLAADRLEGTLRLSSLLVGKIEVSSLALKRPQLNLIATKSGERSWDFKRGVLADAAAGQLDQAMPIKSVRMIQGQIAYSDAASGESTTVAVDDATLNWSGLADSLSVSGMINWRRREVEVSASLTDPAALISGGKSDLRVKVKGDVLNLSLSGNIDGDGRLEGKTTASGTSLRSTLRWLGLDLPEGKSLASFEMQSPVVLDAAGITLDGVELSLDNNEAEGSLMVQISGPRPKVSGTLAADTIDLTPYSNEMRISTVKSPQQWRNDRINLKGMVVSDLDLRISSGETVIDKVRIGRTAVAVSTQDGLLDVAVGEASAYGGTLKGRMTLKIVDGKTEFTASGNFDQVEMAGSLGDFLGFHHLEGSGGGRIELSASGASVADLARSLEGKADIVVSNGALVGVDLPDLMEKIKKRPLSARFESSYGGRTAFDKAQVTFNIANGLAQTSDCRLESANLAVTLKGDANIAQRTLDMAGVSNSTQAGDDTDPFHLPFRVYGDWEAPVVEPDAQALIRQSGAAAPLLRGFGKGSQDTPAATPSAQ